MLGPNTDVLEALKVRRFVLPVILIAPEEHRHRREWASANQFSRFNGLFLNVSERCFLNIAGPRQRLHGELTLPSPGQRRRRPFPMQTSAFLRHISAQMGRLRSLADAVRASLSATAFHTTYMMKRYLFRLRHYLDGHMGTLYKTT